MFPPTPHPDDDNSATYPSLSGVPVRAGDNGNDDVTPVAGVNSVVKNSHDVNNVVVRPLPICPCLDGKRT